MFFEIHHQMMSNEYDVSHTDPTDSVVNDDEII